jgi:hypothetical protein
MRISIDLDGCLWHHQTFFRSFIKAMQVDGHQVGILTSHKIMHKPADLALLEKRNFPAPDFYIGRPMESGGADYAVLKSRAIMDGDIQLHFDDGDAAKLRTLLGNQRYRVISMTPRGGEDEHFE